MTVLADWIDRTDWSRRSVELGGLREHRDRDGAAFVAMELAARPHASAELARLWELWRGLPSHPYVLEPLEPHGDGPRLLRYAAIDWTRSPIAPSGDPRGADRIATWGVELVRACEHLSSFVARDILGWFACPILWIDLEGAVRLAFVPAYGDAARTARLPPEVVDHGPRCDDRGLIFVVGRLLRDLVVPEAHAPPIPVCQVIDRCLAADPAQRFATLTELLDAFLAAGGRRKPPHDSRRPRRVRSLVETGLGYLALGQPTKAVTWFAQAVEQARLAHTGRAAGNPPSEHARAIRACRDEVILLAARGDALAWTDAQSTGRQLEQQRRFNEALALYQRVRRDGADLAALELAIARCSFQLRVDALLRAHQYADALAVASSWLALAPDDGRAQLARGKSLLGLGRVVDARDAFELASSRGPHILEAMMLRRDLDRAVRDVRAAAGTASAAAIDVPDHLAELRDVLGDGRTHDAIDMLRRPRYERDAAAQLLLAHLWSFEAHYADAIAVYDRVQALGDSHRHAALLGKADALLESGRPDEALAVFERVAAERADLSAALDGRARALRRLGRIGEANEAFQQYVAIAGHRSELRVRSR